MPEVKTVYMAWQGKPMESNLEIEICTDWKAPRCRHQRQEHQVSYFAPPANLDKSADKRSGQWTPETWAAKCEQETLALTRSTAEPASEPAPTIIVNLR